MAASFNVLTRGHLGSTKAVVVEFTPDSTYAAGGVAVTPATFGLTQIVAIFAESVGAAAAGAVGISVRYDRTNSKLQEFRSGGAAADFPESGNVDHSAKKTVLLVLGH
jgi:hypothetical protein